MKLDAIPFINEAKFNRFHLTLLILGLVILLFDGFDLVIYGAVVPVLMEEWNMSPIEAGALGSYALIGMTIGSMFFGTIGDKIGKKRVIIICVLLFSIFTLILAFANSPFAFGVGRFIAGLGLGGVMPNIVSLMSDYAPKKIKATLITIMCSGYGIGGVLSAVLSMWLIPDFGWRSVFLIGATPLLLIIPIIYLLPDSPPSYIKRNQHKQLGLILQKANKTFSYNEKMEFQIKIESTEKSSVAKLFQNNRGKSTLMFWIVSFMTLLVLYGLNTWLPKIMATAGFPLGSSLMFLMMLNLGGVIGTVIGGWISDRWNAKNVLIIYYILSIVSLSMMGFKPGMGLFYLLVFIAGATSIGSQIILNAYVTSYYEADIRATGLGWALAIGRVGSILGPTLGGVLLTQNLPVQFNFIAFAIPGLIAVICMLFIQSNYSNSLIKEKEIVEESV